MRSSERVCQVLFVKKYHFFIVHEKVTNRVINILIEKNSAIIYAIFASWLIIGERRFCNDFR